MKTMETHVLYAHAELQFLSKFDCVDAESQYKTFRLFVPKVIFFLNLIKNGRDGSDSWDNEIDNSSIINWLCFSDKQAAEHCFYAFNY